MVTPKNLITTILEQSGPITSAHILENQDYERYRGALLEWAGEFKAKRRLSVGSDFTLLFENRATVWLQVQEELRWVSELTPHRLRPILAEHNGLVPSPGEFRACLFMNTTDPKAIDVYRQPAALSALNLTLYLGGREYQSDHIEKRAIGLAPVSYLAFVPRKTRSIGADRLHWSLPRPGLCKLPSLTRHALLEELNIRWRDAGARSVGSIRHTGEYPLQDFFRACTARG